MPGHTMMRKCNDFWAIGYQDRYSKWSGKIWGRSTETFTSNLSLQFYSISVHGSWNQNSSNEFVFEKAIDLTVRTEADLVGKNHDVLCSNRWIRERRSNSLGANKFSSHLALKEMRQVRFSFSRNWPWSRLGQDYSQKQRGDLKWRKPHMAPQSLQNSMLIVHRPSL